MNLDGNHLILPCTLHKDGKGVQIDALVDSGANGMAFIDQTFAQKHDLKLELLRHPRRLEVVDGRQSVAGRITHMTRIPMNIQGHREALPCFVTKLSQQPIVLGIPWLKLHDVTISWKKNTLTFDSAHCHEHCGVKKRIVICGITKEDPMKKPTKDTEKNTLDIRMIGAFPFLYLTDKARKKSEDFTIFAASMADIEKALAPKTKIEPKEKLPPEYHEFLDVFSQTEADKLPPHRAYDHKIRLKEGTEPPFGPLYDMSRDELLVLREYLEENLGKGFIRASRSPAASPVLFVRKPGGGLRFCVDYRALNALTVKNRYPIPLIRETLDRLCKAQYYTKLDIIAAFNRLRIAKGDEWKTAFRTRYGLFEYLVMPFGLTNGPASFQHYVNDALREYLDIFCTAYLDDILIYSNSLSEHKRHVRQILQRLKEYGLQADIAKCEFHVQEVKYLGLIVSTDGIQMDPVKVSAVKEWPTPQNVKDIQSFLGFANFYRRFIKRFATKANPLTRLTKKDTPFTWDDKCQTAFEELKEAFTSAPILRHFDPDKPSTIECDSSDYVNAGCLSQPDPDGTLHPVAFFSRKLSPAECNYDIYDKELMAVVQSFEEWRAELEGAATPVQVISDHKNLQHFMTTKRLSRRQARWSEFLSRFEFKLIYRPGTQGGKPDALTRRSSDMPQTDDDERLRHQDQTVIKPQNISPGMHPLALKQNTLHENHDDTQQPLDDLITAAYKKDPIPAKIREIMDKHDRQLPTELARLKIPINEMVERDGRLFVKDRMFVPDDDELRLRLLRSCHDNAAAGHPGRAKTHELLSRNYYWPNMGQAVKRYVRNCHTCSRSKASRLPYQGLLQPLGTPNARWEDIAVDFIVELPRSKNETTGQFCKNIMVVTDRLSKQRHFIACGSTNAKHTAQLFLHHVWKHHGLPTTIVSDRGTQFTSRLWQRLCQRLGISTRLSTAYHPESDGQSENSNQGLEQYLRAYVNYSQDDWVNWLPLAEFAINNHQSATTGVTPFYAVYGQHPRMGHEPPQGTRKLPAKQQIDISTADAFANEMARLTEILRLEMTMAQAQHAEYANENRMPAPHYREGDEVWLETKNLSIERPARKLSEKFIGPFRIAEVMGPVTYRLELPPAMRIHDVFHTSLLRPAASDPLPSQNESTQPRIRLNKDNTERREWMIEKILDSRITKNRHGKRRLEYYVRWKGYSPSWRPQQDLVPGSGELLYEFHNQNPDRPSPTELWRRRSS